MKGPTYTERDQKREQRIILLRKKIIANDFIG